MSKEDNPILDLMRDGYAAVPSSCPFLVLWVEGLAEDFGRQGISGTII